MMTAIFATLMIALALELAQFRRAAVSCLLLSLVLALALFLWEIDSPDYGFRMPWLAL